MPSFRTLLSRTALAGLGLAAGIYGIGQYHQASSKLLYDEVSANGIFSEFHDHMVTVEQIAKEITKEADKTTSDNKIPKRDLPGGNEDSGISPDDELLISAFEQAGYNTDKAYGMLACYKAGTECGLNSFEVLGLLGCAACEGYPGVVQGGFELEGFGKSGNSYDKYLRIDTSAKVAAWSANIIKNRGCGTAQWTDTQYKGTWSYRGKNYVDTIGKYVTDTPVDYKTIWKADYDTYKSDLSGGYNVLIKEMSQHNSSLEAVVVYSMFRYEAGYGNYKKSDSIDSYTGTFNTYLKNRYAAAQAIQAAFVSKGILK